MKDGAVDGHVVKYVSRVICFFLKRVGSVGLCEVTGGRIIRGVGLGLEILCTYKFYGHQAYLDRLQTLLLSAADDHTTVTTKPDLFRLVWTPDPSGRAKKGLGNNLARKCLECWNAASVLMSQQAFEFYQWQKVNIQ